LAPRLYVKLMGGAGSVTGEDRFRPPLGEQVWQDTAVHLPTDLDAPLRGVLDGARVPQTSCDGRPAIRAAAALASFPVALLATGTASGKP
jgi:hypothetical protein